MRKSTTARVIVAYEVEGVLYRSKAEARAALFRIRATERLVATWGYSQEAAWSTVTRIDDVSLPVLVKVYEEVLAEIE